MKVKTKKHTKKQSKTKQKKSQNTKVTTRSSKNKKHIVDTKKVDKQPCNKSTSKGKKKGDNLPFKKGNKHGFKKGKSGNSKGRPKLGMTKLDSLINAIARYQIGIKPNDKNVVDQFIKRAFASDTVLIALHKKLFPDLKSIEQITREASDTEKEEAHDIQKILQSRFEE